MEKSLFRNSIFLVLLFAGAVQAGDISGKFRRVKTFTDDREVVTLNSDLDRITANIIDDKFINISICSVCISTGITFNNSQADTGYGVFAMTSWAGTSTWVNQKTTTGCVINFPPPGASGGTLDAILVR